MSTGVRVSFINPVIISIGIQCDDCDTNATPLLGRCHIVNALPRRLYDQCDDCDTCSPYGTIDGFVDSTKEQVAEFDWEMVVLLS